MRRILLEKLVTALLTACLVIPFEAETVIVIYIVMGHAHFLIAYYYKKLAGMITKAFLLNYVFWFSVLVIGYYRWPSYHHLTAVATIYFLFHMVFDEMYLSRIPMNLRNSPMHIGRMLETLPIILVLGAYVVDSLFPYGPRTIGPNPIMPVALKVCYFAFIPYIGLLASRRYRPDWRSGYFWAASFLLLYCGQFNAFEGTPVAKFTGTVIIYHYLNWYFHYYLNLPTWERRALYLKRVAVLNLVVFIPFFTIGASGIGKYFFQEDYFYIWTMMHLITSTRSGDVVGLLLLPKKLSTS